MRDLCTNGEHWLDAVKMALGSVTVPAVTSSTICLERDATT